jgi:hypothetical protein
MLMSRIRTILLAALPLAAAGCDVDVKGLKEASAALDRFSAEAEKVTNPESGNLKKLLGDAKKELSTLIREAEDAGGRLEGQVVRDFVIQRQALISDILSLEKKIFGDANFFGIQARGILASTTEEANQALRSFSSDLSSQMFQAISILQGMTGIKVKQPLKYKGMVIPFRLKGFYVITITIPDAFNLGLKIGDEVISPQFPTQGEAAFKLPVEDLKDRFKDTDRRSVPIKLVELNRAKEEIRYVGNLFLEPLFPIEYLRLTERGPNGMKRDLAVEGGPAIQDALAAAAEIMKKKGNSPVEIAERHGQIFNLARKRLLNGTSVVMLSPGFNDWEMLVILENGETTIVDQNQPSFGDVRVRWKSIQDETGNQVIQLTIDVNTSR